MTENITIELECDPANPPNRANPGKLKVASLEVDGVRIQDPTGEINIGGQAATVSISAPDGIWFTGFRAYGTPVGAAGTEPPARWYPMSVDGNTLVGRVATAFWMEQFGHSQIVFLVQDLGGAAHNECDYEYMVYAQDAEGAHYQLDPRIVNPSPGGN